MEDSQGGILPEYMPLTPGNDWKCLGSGKTQGWFAASTESIWLSETVYAPMLKTFLTLDSHLRQMAQISYDIWQLDLCALENENLNEEIPGELFPLQSKFPIPYVAAWTNSTVGVWSGLSFHWFAVVLPGSCHVVIFTPSQVGFCGDFAWFCTSCCNMSITVPIPCPMGCTLQLLIFRQYLRCQLCLF